MVKKGSIIKNTILVTMITFFVKFLGLIKQSVIAAICGATAETDAFFVGSSVIVQLCIVFFSAISVSLLSVHTEILAKEGREKSNELVNVALRVFLPIALTISLVFYLLSTPIARVLAPSYNGEQLQILAQYIQIMSAAFVLWCYYLIINVVLETEKIFIPGKMQGLFQNVFLILAAIFLYHQFGIIVFLYAFLLSGIAQCILVTICAHRCFRFSFHKIKVGNQIKQVVALAVPLIIGNAIYEINDIVDKQLSTGLGEGNVSYLTYGATVNEIVTGVIVTSVSTVLFSHYATWIAEGNREKVETNLERCLKYLTVLIIPIMAMCISAGDQIVQIIYGRGNFDENDVQMTYGVVIGYALGFVFQAARANMTKVLYAFQNTKKPMINGAIAVGSNIILSIILSKLIGVGGIAVATSIAMFIVTLLLVKDVKQYLPGLSLKCCLKEALKGLVAGVVATVIVWFLHRLLTLHVLLNFFIEGMTCLLVYIILMTFMKSTCIMGIRRKCRDLVRQIMRRKDENL